MVDALTPVDYISVDRTGPARSYAWLGKPYATSLEAEQAAMRTIEDEIEHWNKADTSIVSQLMEYLDFENQWGVKAAMASRRATLYTWLDTVRRTPRKMRASAA